MRTLKNHIPIIEKAKEECQYELAAAIQEFRETMEKAFDEIGFDAVMERLGALPGEMSLGTRIYAPAREAFFRVAFTPSCLMTRRKTMFEIKITGNSAAEALADLAELAGMMGLSAAPAGERSKPHPPAETVRSQTNRSKTDGPAAEPVSESVPEPEAPAGDWEPGGGALVEEPVSARPALTQEIVREAGIKAARAHGKPAIQAIFRELGVSGLTSMPPERYPEFMRKLGELNAE